MAPLNCAERYGCGPGGVLGRSCRCEHHLPSPAADIERKLVRRRGPYAENGERAECLERLAPRLHTGLCRPRRIGHQVMLDELSRAAGVRRIEDLEIRPSEPPGRGVWYRRASVLLGNTLTFGRRLAGSGHDSQEMLPVRQLDSADERYMAVAARPNDGRLALGDVSWLDA